MEQQLLRNYILLGALTALWCILHSVFITLGVQKIFKDRLKSAYAYYRLSYNVFSVLTLVPVVYLEYTLGGAELFSWSGLLNIPRALFLIVSMLLFWLGARQYSIKEFVGISHLRSNTHNLSLSGSGILSHEGIHTIVRHPWYLGALIFLWLRHLDFTALIVNTVLSAYLIVGAYMEERKLIMQFGDAYRDYQEKVAMWIPWRWALRKCIFRKNK